MQVVDPGMKARYRISMRATLLMQCALPNILYSLCFQSKGSIVTVLGLGIVVRGLREPPVVEGRTVWWDPQAIRMSVPNRGGLFPILGQA